MAKVLVIDDDAGLYSLLEEYFSQTEFHSEHAMDAESGLSRLLETPEDWDAVVLDVMLPGMNGLQVLQRLRDRTPTRELPVLMLTAQGEEEQRIAGLEAGADDYLAKPFSLRELSARLRAILRRTGKRDAEPACQSDVIRVDNLTLDRSAFCVECEGKNIGLTPMELRLLEALLETPGRIVSRDELYRRVFGHDAFHYDRSLDMAISRLRKKLGPRSDGGERIRAAWGTGYVFLLPGTPS